MSSIDSLPEYLVFGLDIVITAMNPGLTTDQRGYYCASTLNRFWPVVNDSKLVIEPVVSYSDCKVTQRVIGLTDVLKRPSAGCLRYPRCLLFQMGALAKR